MNPFSDSLRKSLFTILDVVSVLKYVIAVVGVGLVGAAALVFHRHKEEILTGKQRHLLQDSLDGDQVDTDYLLTKDDLREADGKGAGNPKGIEPSVSLPT